MPGEVLIICKGLDNLQGGAQHVARRVAGTGQLAVGIAVLDHQAAQVQRIVHQFAGLFDGHAFLFAQFAQQLCVFFRAGIVIRVDDSGLANVTQAPLFGAGMDFIRVAQQNQVGNSLCQYQVGSFQCAFFRAFRKDNALAVRFGALNDFIN